MNYPRIVVAVMAGWLAFFISGTMVFGLSPLARFYAPCPGVYRSQVAVMSYFPIGLVTTVCGDGLGLQASRPCT